MPVPGWISSVMRRARPRPAGQPESAIRDRAETAVATRPDRARADVELTIPRARLAGFAAALVGEHGLGAGPLSPDRLTAAVAGAIARAGGTGSPSVSRSPAGLYTPEYWRFRIEAADALAQEVLDRAGRIGRDA